MKPKTCRTCQKQFQPSNSLQRVCSYRCAIQLGKIKKEKKFKQIVKISGKDEDKLIRKADALFQQAGIKLYPRSIIGGEPTQVIHHRIKKSESNATRYYMPNAVPLTNKEHWDLHNGSASTKEIEIDIKLGQDRLQDLNNKRKEICKLTESYLQGVINDLQSNN